MPLCYWKKSFLISQIDFKSKGYVRRRLLNCSCFNLHERSNILRTRSVALTEPLSLFIKSINNYQTGTPSPCLPLSLSSGARWQAGAPEPLCVISHLEFSHSYFFFFFSNKSSSSSESLDFTPPPDPPPPVRQAPAVSCYQVRDQTPDHSRGVGCSDDAVCCSSSPQLVRTLKREEGGSNICPLLLMVSWHLVYIH